MLGVKTSGSEPFVLLRKNYYERQPTRNHQLIVLWCSSDCGYSCTGCYGFKMNLRESIKDIPDDDWLDLTEELRANYKVFMGRCPKKCITGEVLDYEVLTIGDIRYQEDYTLHKFLVKDNWRPKEVSQ